LDVLNYSGSSFLSLYFMICGLALLAIAGLQFLTWHFRPFGANGSNGVDDLTAAETAYAAGGEARMAHVLMMSMLDSGAIRIERSGKPSVAMVTALKEPNTLEEHFSWGWLASQPGGTASYASFHRKLIEKARSVRDKLGSGGWLWAEREMHRTRLAARVLALAVIGLGVVKILIGVTRDRPVGYLVFGVIAFYVCYCILRSRLTGIGRSGPTRGATEALERQRAAREGWREQPDADLGSTLLWSAALFGAGALAGSAWDAHAAMVEAEQQRVAAMMRGTGGGGGGSASDYSGGSSCSTGSSCSSGSSCGSSGCGGCSSSSSD
ncbi:TIGR04222 domain-containing membrane protein, partial [Burkholderia sp. Ac-20379]|uniref:TIGR04222 domain-containing membrane protein n=1 Tax=Burkholderia sp. Ac-20379 TaxID=2703900 RepID=UPI00197E736A